MKTRSKVLSATLAATIMLSLVGCGGTSETAEQNAADSATTETIDSETTEATDSADTSTTEAVESDGAANAEAAGKTVIKYIDGFTGADGPYMMKIIDGFNNSQDQYYVDALQDADEYTKFKTGDFDMLVIHADWMPTYVQDGLLRDISDVYEKAGLSLEENFHPISEEICKIDGTLYGLPLDLYPETMYYNKKYVEKAPESYEDLIALRDKLDSENSGIYPISLPLTGDHQWAWMTAIGQSGVNWVEDGHIKLDTEEACDAFMKIHDLIYKDHLSASGLGDNDQFNTFIKNSEDTDVSAVISLTGPWNYTPASEVLGDDLAIATIPQIYGGEKKVPAGAHCFAVSADCNDENKIDGIAAFMKYTFEPENLIIWAGSGQAPLELKTIDMVKEDAAQYPVANVNYSIFDDAMFLPDVYNVRSQVDYVNKTVWSTVIQTEDLSQEDLMDLLQTATETAEEISEQ